MVVGVCKFILSLEGNRSLKGKRRVLKSLLTKLRNQFNVSVAEVDLQNTPDTAVVGLALVGSDARFVNSQLDVILSKIEFMTDAVVVAQEFELEHY